jgi:hypothetical protein
MTTKNPHEKISIHRTATTAQLELGARHRHGRSGAGGDFL